MFRGSRVGLVAATVGALVALVLPFVVSATAAHGSGSEGDAGAAESIHFDGINVLTIAWQSLGQDAPGAVYLVRVNCTNNFDGNPTNNTSPGPSTDPIGSPPSGGTTVDGFVYLVFGEGQPATQRVLDPAVEGTSDSCKVQRAWGGLFIEEVEYAATSDDPDTIMEIVQPPPGLGFAKVTWPTGVVAPAGDAAQVTITSRFPSCEPNCLDWGLVPTNQIRVKNRIRGDAPDPPSFALRLRCSGRGITEERLLTFTDQAPVTVDVSPARNRCVLKETDTGGADRVEYFAQSRTGADTSFGPNSARVDFADTAGFGGGGHALLRVTNRFPGTCPATAPGYC